MGFFTHFLESKGIRHQIGKALWRYQLSEDDYRQLKESIENHIFHPNTRDIALYFAEWWRREFNGGTPTKIKVYESLSQNFREKISLDGFWKIAKKGGQSLRLPWIKKQNTLYLRTLFLQGGLPRKNMIQNKGKYLDFLLAVLESQPGSVEDIRDVSSLTNKLPSGSRQDAVYENCFEIVKAYREGETNEIIQSLREDPDLKEIDNRLLIRSKELRRKPTKTKPKIQWIMELEEEPFIYLNLGFPEKLSIESLEAILGFAPQVGSYQLYIDEIPVCSFRKTGGGDYRLEWEKRSNFKWENEKTIPEFTARYEEMGVLKKIFIPDFIQFSPDFSKPSLWSPVSETTWRLERGVGTKGPTGIILCPDSWESEKAAEHFQINDIELNLIQFEGVIQMRSDSGKEMEFRTNMETFDWTILPRNRPQWLFRSNKVVVRKSPRVIVYDSKGFRISEDKFQVFYKPSDFRQEWSPLTLNSNLPLGLVELRIEKDDVSAWDEIYNIGTLDFEEESMSFDRAVLKVKDLSSRFKVKLDETDLVSIEMNDSDYRLSLKTANKIIPRFLKAKVKVATQRSLFLELYSPFVGVRILDVTGKVMEHRSKLNLHDLNGFRIIKPKDKEGFITLKNVLNPQIRIEKKIEEASYPLRELKDDLYRLFYLSDAMGWENEVRMDVKVESERVTYFFSGFTDLLNVEEQNNHRVSLQDNPEKELDLLAIPLKENSKEVEVISLEKNGLDYILGEDIEQAIIISSNLDEKSSLMPRFVNTDPDYRGLSPEARIEKYHKELKDASFGEEVWEKLCSLVDFCQYYQIPFSTFDQIRAISRSSEVASQAFVNLITNHRDPERFFQEAVPALEKELGFCFHWIRKEDWELAIDEIVNLWGAECLVRIMKLLRGYFDENNLVEIFYTINEQNTHKMRVLREDLRAVRQHLGSRVLNELPRLAPRIGSSYGIPLPEEHHSLLVNAPVAVAESVLGKEGQYSIWGGGPGRAAIRRNIQYLQFLIPHFYKKVIAHVITR